ncbi:hypothetical protein [Rugamonas aquatica]|uniref:SMODS and SLOG-associating 2TM effector domain-containing protein n=1 Tax=Rugamonas aquatica TaxID=2743357 RepID=A0A6A7N0T0_9BURK|nr:hypothetical protein [Rugamonas aquatica]MQA38629.1 hypothetical protein [Rugamonas aquatica]
MITQGDNVGHNEPGELAKGDAAEDDFLWSERLYVQYRAELSTLYHRKRERFFALCDRCSKAASLIAGTAAFSSLLPTAEAKAWAGVVVAASTMPGLVMAWNDRARLHGELAQKFLAVEAEIVAKGKRDFTESDLNTWLAKILAIEASEPPTLGGLTAVCHNQLATSNGNPESIVKISKIKRFFMHIFDMEIAWPEAPTIPGHRKNMGGTPIPVAERDSPTTENNATRV